MKSFLLPIAIILAIMALIVSAFSQRAGGSSSRANTLASMPIQVMGEGRLTNIATGTGLLSFFNTMGTISNSFSGYWQTNATWILYTNGFGGASAATGAPIVGPITSLESLTGYYQPTVSIPTDENAKNWLTSCALGSNDICPQINFKAGLRPAVLVVGFTIAVSNWTSSGVVSTFRGFDVLRIGQSPYAIAQFQDNVDAPNQLCMLAHSPDGAGVGGAVIVFDNGEVYDCMLLYDAPQDKAGLKIFLRLGNGRRKFLGESFLPMTSSTAAENVFLSMHDDHSPYAFDTSVGGDIRMSHYWMTTNREIYNNNLYPRY